MNVNRPIHRAVNTLVWSRVLRMVRLRFGKPGLTVGVAACSVRGVPARRMYTARGWVQLELACATSRAFFGHYVTNRPSHANF